MFLPIMIYFRLRRQDGDNEASEKLYEKAVQLKPNVSAQKEIIIVILRKITLAQNIFFFYDNCLPFVRWLLLT